MINADLFVEAVPRSLEFVLAAVADPVTEVGARGVHLLRGRVAPDGQPLEALLGASPGVLKALAWFLVALWSVAGAASAVSRAS